MFTCDSRPTKPGASRPLGLERLEQRTVLSASQIVVVALDAGSVPAGGPPQPEQHFSALVASAIQVLERPRTWNLEVLQPTRHVEDVSWLVGWQILQAIDAVAMGQDARHQLARNTAGGQLSNPRAVSVSLLLRTPRVMLPESSTNSSLAEGEWSPPGRATNPSDQAFSTELTQASRAADPTPVKEQLPSAAAVDATFGSQLRDAVRDQLPTISAIDWSFATWENRAANALNRALGWRDSSTAIGIPFAQDPFSDLRAWTTGIRGPIRKRRHSLRIAMMRGPEICCRWKTVHSNACPTCQRAVLSSSLLPRTGPPHGTTNALASRHAPG